MPVTTNTRKLAALLGASGAGIGTDGKLRAAMMHTDMATQAELDVVSTAVDNIDFTPLRQDISILALKEAISENRTTLNLPNSLIETFEDETGLTLTNVSRDDTTEYVSGILTDTTRVGTLQFLGSAQDAVSGLDNGSALTVNATTGQISIPTTLVFTAATNADNYTTRLDLGETIEISSPFRISYEGCTGGTGSSPNNRIGIVELNMSTGDNTGYLFHHNGSSGTAPTITKEGSSWGDLGGTPNSIVNQTFTSYEGYYAADSTTTKWVQFAWSGDPISARYLYVGSTATKGIPTTLRFQHGSPLADFATVAASTTGELIAATNTVAAAKTKVSGVMLYKDNTGTATLGTDLRIYVTCNGGTNWTEVLLADMTVTTPVFSTGIKMVKLAEKTCTSGTDIRYKVAWANQSAASIPLTVGSGSVPLSSAGVSPYGGTYKSADLSANSSSNNWLETGDLTSASQAITTGDWTIDYWFKDNTGDNVNNLTMFSFGDVADNANPMLRAVYYGTAVINVWTPDYSTSANNLTGAGRNLLWRHLSFQYDADGGSPEGEISVWEDGLYLGKFDHHGTGNSNTDGLFTGQSLQIGSRHNSATENARGYIADFRVSNVKRHTDATTFSVPTSPYTSDSNTVMLYGLSADVTTDSSGGGSIDKDTLLHGIGLNY